MGYSVRTATLTIDLNAYLNKVKVAPDRASAVVGGGARLGDLYYSVWRQAGDTTAAVAGTCPIVGVGGHILGE